MQAGAGAVALTGALTVTTIALSPNAIANYGAVTATTAVNIRTSPTTSANILGVLYKGQKLTQVGAIKSGWVPVKYGSKTAWIAANYLAGARASESSSATSASGSKGDAWTTEPLNVRTGPSIKYSIKTTLKKGTKVERTGLVSAGFTQIWYGDSRAWVSTAYLGQTQPSSGTITTQGSVKATAALQVRSSSGRGIAGYTDIPKGTVLPATGEVEGKLTEVVWRSQRVWVTSAYVSKVGSTPTAEPEELPREIGTRYATTALNVRTGAGTSYALVTTVAQGTALKITGTVTNGFAQVNYNGAARWVSAAYLSSTPGGSGDGGSSGGGNSGGGTGAVDLTGSIGLNGLKASTRNIVNVVAARYGMTTFYGVRPDALPDHPSGHAVDIMLPKWNTSAGNAKGWEIANWLRANASQLDIQYIIFDQKIWNVARDREGWRAMADRGSSTANHKDHLHVTTKGL